MKKSELLKAELEKMYAIELLEYHDKNHLSGDNKIRCERRLEMLLYSIRLISEDIKPIDKERILDAPVKYDLIDIFKELKFGRPSENQKFLQKCIDELMGYPRKHDKLEMQLAFEAGSKNKDFEKWYKNALKKLL